MKPTFPVAVMMLVFAAACTTGGESPPVESEELLPGGYRTVLDTERSDPGQFRVTREDEYLHIMTGPGGIAWRPGDVVEGGNFLAEATLTVIGAPPGYREAYGVFVGGHDLDGPDQRYTYLLVRPAGDFLVKRQLGDSTEVLVDWTSHEAVQRVSVDGEEPVNAVGIMVMGDEVSFLVNGTTVHRMPVAEMEPYGVAGLRINHRLDLRIPSWYLGAPPLRP